MAATQSSRREEFDLDLKAPVRGGWAGWRGPLAATGLAAYR